MVHNDSSGSSVPIDVIKRVDNDEVQPNLFFKGFDEGAYDDTCKVVNLIDEIHGNLFS